MTLGVKVGRRLVAVSALQDEQFTFHDSRFVPSRRAGIAGLGRYFRQVIDQVHPTVVYVYTPAGSGKVTAEVARVLEEEATRAQVTVKSLSRADVFASFGLVPIRTRQELRNLMRPFWPDLESAKVQRQDALAEAAATALVGDLYQEWPPV